MVEEVKTGISVLWLSVKGFVVLCACFFLNPHNKIQCVFVLFLRSPVVMRLLQSWSVNVIILLLREKKEGNKNAILPSISFSWNSNSYFDVCLRSPYDKELILSFKNKLFYWNSGQLGKCMQLLHVQHSGGRFVGLQQRSATTYATTTLLVKKDICYWPLPCVTFI